MTLSPQPTEAPIDLESSLAETTSSKRISWKQILKITISIVIMALLLHYTGFENILARLSKANLWYIPVCVALYTFTQVVSSYRWQFLSAALNFRLPWKTYFEYYLMGMFFSLFLPGSIGGDMVRLLYMSKRTQRKKREVLLTLLAERGVGLVALLLLTSSLCMTPILRTMGLEIPINLHFIKPMFFDLRWLLVALSGGLILGYGLLWLLPLEKLAQRIPALSLLCQAKVYWSNVSLLTKSVSLSVGAHAILVLIHGVIAHALNIHVPILYLGVIYGVVSLASVLPIAFNGFGVREGTYLLLLTKVGVRPDTAMAFAFYWVIISTLTSLLGGLLLATHKKHS